MTQEKMTIHQALSELKILDKRIYNKIADFTNKNTNSVVHGKPIGDFKTTEKDKFVSIKDLTNRRNAIKKAVVLSNAKTMVTIAGVEMTVAEAIEMKVGGIELTKDSYNNMKRQYASAKMECERCNRDLAERADKYVEGTFGSTDKKSGKDLEEMEKVRRQFIENNTYKVVACVDIEEEIAELEQFLDRFDAEVDAALSVSNAITQIEIEY